MNGARNRPPLRVVLAPSRPAYTEWRARLGTEEAANTLYLTSATQLRGLHRDFVVVVMLPGWDFWNADAAGIKEAVQAGGFEVERVET